MYFVQKKNTAFFYIDSKISLFENVVMKVQAGRRS